MIVPKLVRIQPEFVDAMPSRPEPGKLYISIKYATTQHLCACGCESKVVLPLSPAEWSLRYDGDTVSMNPSVGNWEYTCKSHYWIEQNRIRWARPWTPAEIEAGRAQDRRDLESYFASRAIPDAPTTIEGRTSVSVWSRIVTRFRRILRQ